MMNILDRRTYVLVPLIPGLSKKSAIGLMAKHDANSIPAKERYEMAHARGRCLEILCWFFSVYEIFDKDVDEPIDGFNQVAMHYLAHQGSTILEFKRRHLESGLDDGELCELKV